MKSIVVIPTYNEAENIVPLIKQIQKETDLHVLVVDDNSPDGTAEKVEEVEGDFVHLLKRDGKYGLGHAYVAGFSWALDRGYEMIGQMDADFSHDVKEIPAFLDELCIRSLTLGADDINIYVILYPVFDLFFGNLTFERNSFSFYGSGGSQFSQQIFQEVVRLTVNGIHDIAVITHDRGFTFVNQVDLGYRESLRGINY